MPEKKCLICGKDLTGRKAETCSSVCRSKLYRLRHAKPAPPAQETKDMRAMAWLEHQSPKAAAALWKLKAIYGEDAFNLALDAVRRVAVTFPQSLRSDQTLKEGV